MTLPAVPLPPRAPGTGAAAKGGADAFDPRRVHSDDLLRGSREIEIIHRSQCYRLRITSLGKLILTK
jgi:hemin uptake protein HemP